MRPEADAGELAAHLGRLEHSLLDPAVRRDASRLRSLLTEDFEEFGASGRKWTLASTIEALANESFDPPAIEDFRCVRLSEDIALVTYRTVPQSVKARSRRQVLRSSVWIRQAGEWRMRFHQGTPALDPAS